MEVRLSYIYRSITNKVSPTGNLQNICDKVLILKLYVYEIFIRLLPMRKQNKTKPCIIIMIQ